MTNFRCDVSIEISCELTTTYTAIAAGDVTRSFAPSSPNDKVIFNFPSCVNFKVVALSGLRR